MTVVLIRTLILYVTVIFSVRLMGKRQIGQMQPTELVITILISNIATLSLEDPDTPILIALIPILFLVSFDVLVSVVTLKSRKFRRLVSGTPQIIINDGVLDQEKLKALRMSLDDLLESLRSINIFDISQVQFAIVETNGKISAYQKNPYQPAEKQDTGNKDESMDPPYIIIDDGELLKKGQQAIQMSDSHLESILKKNKSKIKDIFLLCADRNKKYTIIKKEKSNGGNN